ncbi:MAG TPA: membrane protein insertion efficiency factor YidD [Clostridia bacterium]|nr:membrane protein insertion efficiency factor YidD [Clostridia bacterium]
MNAVQYILIFCLRVYKWVLSPAKSLIFGPAGRCRYSPSCSDYALEAVRVHGACAGTWLALKRLARCHPWGGCGWDPVPSRHPSVHRPKTGCACTPAPVISAACEDPDLSGVRPASAKTA